MTNDYAAVLRYIEDYWQTALMSPKTRPRNMAMWIGQVHLPNAFIAPNHSYFSGTQFYWDSYFTILGLVDSNHSDIAKGMVDNLCYLFDKFGVIPARNSLTSKGRTQPPYLTKMAWEVYNSGSADDAWMQKVMACAAQEYKTVWTAGRRYDENSSLSLYNPKYFTNRLTVFESGWDKSSRFINPKNSILPVDLNCLLYTYEADLLAWAIKCHDSTSQAFWRAACDMRRASINQYFWNEETGFYFDYSRESGQLETLATLAGFYPLWCGVATKQQAESCRRMLRVFEHSGGLASTEKLPLSTKQWDYPNGWAPLQFIVIEGLKRYGYSEDAARLTRKWLDCNLEVFNSTGKLWEKYDVVKCTVGRPGRYPTQPGFGWTNGVFVRLTSQLTS